MLYNEQDWIQNKERLKRELLYMSLATLPFLALAIVAFILRNELFCMAMCFLCGAVIILLTDLRVMPLVRYSHFLKEIAHGLTRCTAGTLVRIGKERIFEEGVWMRECILNVYEDQSEEGERRFLLDCAKEIQHELIGKDVALTSKGNAVVNVQALEVDREQA